MLAACGISDPNAPLILSISRHHPEKRIGTMIDAADKLNRKRPVGLYIIGDGPRRKAVEKHASKVPAVHVAGQIADRQRIATMLASADAMVHCCASETYGLVIAEALCSGLPLIVPDRGGAFDLSAPDYAESHKVGDADACAAAIERLLDRPQEPLRAAAAAAGKTIREPADHFEHLFRHYAEVAEKKRAGTAEKSPEGQ
nr:glycosyltransferase [Kordiimonas marina]